MILRATFQAAGRSSAIAGSSRPAASPKSRPIFRANSSRYASTAAGAFSSRLRNTFYGSVLVVIVAGGYLYVTDCRATAHQYIAPPLLRLLYSDAEDSHHAGTRILKELWTFGLHPRERGRVDEDGMLSIDVFGQTLANPMGISGGLDKNAEIVDPLLALGPSVVEIGGVTPLPQDGNARPRVFRIESQNAVINRYGLNSEGADVVAMRLRQRVRDYAYRHGLGIDENAERLVLDGAAGVPPGSLTSGRLLAVQIAKNKATPEADLDAVVRDHVYCVQQIGKYADIIVVNVSSPNTPGLRSLQTHEPLVRILGSVVEAANAVQRQSKPKVMVKVSPDEKSDSDIQGICDAVWEAGVDGVIVGNTTTRRPDPWPQGFLLTKREAKAMLEHGGFSGPHLFPNTLNLVKKYRKTLDEGPKENLEQSRPKTDSKDADNGTNDETQAAGDGKDKQPLLQIPERHSDSDSSKKDDPKPSTDSSDQDQKTTSTLVQAVLSVVKPNSNPSENVSKVIFASGGITNGEEALRVLNAGASVAMIYTAMTYGGVGTVGRIKGEMRSEVEKKSKGQ